MKEKDAELDAGRAETVAELASSRSRREFLLESAVRCST